MDERRIEGTSDDATSAIPDFQKNTQEYRSDLYFMFCGSR